MENWSGAWTWSQTWLEYECPSNIHVATVACWLNTLAGFNKRANYESCCLADCLKWAKFNGHVGVGVEETTEASSEIKSDNHQVKKWWQKREAIPREREWPRPGWRRVWKVVFRCRRWRGVGKGVRVVVSMLWRTTTSVEGESQA